MVPSAVPPVGSSESVLPGPGGLDRRFSLLGSALSSQGAMGRVVITHSTYLEGLIPLLKQLAGHPLIDTVTPGVIGRVRGRTPGLRLRVSTPIRGGFKLVARRGGSAQEVFVVARCSREDLEALLSSLLA